MDFQKEEEEIAKDFYRTTHREFFHKNGNSKSYMLKIMKKIVTVDEAYDMLLDCAVSSVISLIMIHAFFKKHPDLSSLVIEDLSEENKIFCLVQADKMSTLLEKIYEFDR